MEKRINIAELLKNCPEGMELDSPMYDNVTFGCIVDGNCYPVQVQTPEGNMLLSQHGCMSLSSHAKCVIFPKGKTTWEGFVPPRKFKDGDIVYVKSNKQNEYIIIFKEITDNHVYKYACFAHQYFSSDKCAVCHLVGVEIMRLATEAETKTLFQAIKDHGYKWNAETKTLEKLVEPKFKVGDKVRGKYTNNIYTISCITPTGYELTNGQSFTFNAEDCHELVPNKFDINTLKPFDKVLVRDKNTEDWRAHFFSHYDNNSDRPYICIGVEGINEYKQCIPYESNEYLLCKKDNCDEFYRVWEK